MGAGPGKDAPPSESGKRLVHRRRVERNRIEKTLPVGREPIDRALVGAEEIAPPIEMLQFFGTVGLGQVAKERTGQHVGAGT